MKKKDTSSIPQANPINKTGDWEAFLQKIKKSHPSNKMQKQQPYPVYKIKCKDNNIIGHKLDLHGYNQEGAFEILNHFIKQQYVASNRSLIIITGKGSGVLRENVHKWLQHSYLSKYILHCSQATNKDGGSGALYVKLKKPKSTLTSYTHN